MRRGPLKAKERMRGWEEKAAPLEKPLVDQNLTVSRAGVGTNSSGCDIPARPTSTATQEGKPAVSCCCFH